MHLFWYGNGGLLDAHGFPTATTIVILVGALYGSLRLLYDSARVVIGTYRRATRSAPHPGAPRSPERPDHREERSDWRPPGK